MNWQSPMWWVEIERGILPRTALSSRGCGGRGVGKFPVQFGVREPGQKDFGHFSDFRRRRIGGNDDLGICKVTQSELCHPVYLEPK